jgi:hypothetical protein
MRLQKIFSLFTLVSLSIMGNSQAFMKIETKQIFLPQTETIQNTSYVDMSGMFAQFEAMGMSIDELPPEQKKQLEASFDGVCDQMKTQMEQTQNLSQAELKGLDKETRELLVSMQDSFECKKIGFGKFEIKTTLPLEQEAYKIENNLFIMQANDSTITLEIKQQLDMLMNQQLQDTKVNPEQIEQMKSMGMEVKMVMVFPGKVTESNIGNIDDNTVTIDMWEEIIAAMEAGTISDFIEKLMNMKIVSEIDGDKNSAPELNEETLTFLLETDLEFENEMTDKDFLLEMLMEDESLIDELSDEELLDLLMTEEIDAEPVVVETSTIIKPIIVPINSIQQNTAEPKIMIPAATKNMDKQALEEEVINTIFSSEVFVTPTKSKKKTYSPSRMFQNIKMANSARQAKSNGASRYANFFRNAAK